jgi:hypothetical protein
MVTYAFQDPPLCSSTPIIYRWLLTLTLIRMTKDSCVLEVRPARRTDASAPLLAGAASPPPLLAWGGENLLHLSSPVKETVQ